MHNGGTLWVTGGAEGLWEYSLDSTEFVTTSSSTGGDFQSNGIGPRLPKWLHHHCLEKLSPDMAMVIGGSSDGEHMLIV